MDKVIEVHISTAKQYIKRAKKWKKHSKHACLLYLKRASQQLIMAEIYLK